MFTMKVNIIILMVVLYYCLLLIKIYISLINYLIIFNTLELQAQTVEAIIEPVLNMKDNIGNHGFLIECKFVKQVI